MLLLRLALIVALFGMLPGWAAQPAAAEAPTQATPTVSISPLRGPPGTVVQVTASGFPPNTQLDIGAGRVDTEYTVLTTATTDAQGNLNTQIAIPESAEPGQPWVVVAAVSANPSVRALSSVFAVTEPGEPGAAVYIVQPGDYLAQIARRFGTTVEALLQANPEITNPSLIFPGQRITIPDQAAAQPTVSISPLRGPPGTLVRLEASGFPPNALVEVRVGRPGTEGTAVDVVLVTNAAGNLTALVPIPATANPDELYVVTVATQAEPRITATSNTFAVVSPETTPPPMVYIVQPGDYLALIARRFGTTVDALLRANPEITNPSLIFPGQRITIPSGDAAQPTVSIMPVRGPAGTPVQVNATGFPPNTPVDIGVGVRAAEPAVIYPGQATDAFGRLSTTVAIPPAAQPGEQWVVLVRTTEGAPVSALSNVFAVTEAAAGGPTFTTVPVYLIELGQGNIGCGDALRAVPRQVQPTDQPLRAAIQELLAIEEPPTDDDNLYNALGQSELQLESVNVDAQGTATIRLTGDFQVGGVCDDPRVEAQLEQTALQFPQVRQVQVLINGQPLEELLDLRG